ncbi:hypothetical protein PMAYCL1PPCAC_21578, partial [Pristionchus mayeri]
SPIRRQLDATMVLWLAALFGLLAHASVAIFDNCGDPKFRCFEMEGQNLKLVTNQADFTGPKKLGVYIEYINDQEWKVHFAHEFALSLSKFTIAEEVYGTKDGKAIHSAPANKVGGEFIDEGSRNENDIKYRSFSLKVNSAEADKDLMTAFGFYLGKKNEIKLLFEAAGGPTECSGKGVANYPNYATYVKDHFNFFAISTPQVLPKSPDLDNLFTCEGDEHVFLNSVHMKIKEIRFTKKGWLNTDGVKLEDVKLAGKADDKVFCYSLCSADYLTPKGGTIKPEKADPAQRVFTCKDSAVMVGSNFFDSVRCVNNVWLGDLKTPIALDSTTYKFDAECYGAFKFDTRCTPAEKRDGCGDAILNKNELSCESGYMLKLEHSSSIYSKLKVVKGKWNDGNTDFAPAKAGDRPRCHSRCSINNLELGSNGGEIQQAVYDLPNKELKCSDANEVLVADLGGSDNSYVNYLTCDPVNGWMYEGSVKKAFGTETKVEDLKVNARCYKSCDDQRINDSWQGSNEKSEQHYRDPQKKLTCHSSSVLYVHDNPIDKKVECSKEGWKKEGDANLLIDHSLYYKYNIKVDCFQKCGTFFRSGSHQYANGKVTCDGTNMIKYSVGGGTAEETLNDLSCDNTGWKDGAKVISVFPPGLSVKLQADCVPSCTANAVSEDCSGGRKNCAKPTFSGGELTCAQLGTVLYLDEQKRVELKNLACTRASFKKKDDSFKITRTDAAFKAKITCRSKCDKDFVKIAAPATVAPTDNQRGEYLKRSDEPGEKYAVTCPDPLHYSTLEWAGGKAYSAKPFTCDPITGWSAPDYKNGAIFAEFDGNDVQVGCHPVCADRVDETEMCKGFTGSTPCTKVTLKPNALNTDYKLECPNTHVLRTKHNGVSKNFIRKNLDCKGQGFMQGTDVVLPFKVSDPTGDIAAAKFEAACVSNCHSNFIEGVTPQTDRKISFKKIEILVVDVGGEKKRVFGDLTCTDEEGWKEGTNMIVDFSQHVEFKTSLQEMCDTQQVDMLCDSLCLEAVNPVSNPKPTEGELTCKEHHLLFLNGKHSDDRIAKCDNKGWREDASSKKLIDFMDPAMDITKKTSAICKHKCNSDFIELTTDGCTSGTTCSKPIFENRKLSCSDTTEVLVLEHERLKKEAFEATCDDGGWSRKENTGGTTTTVNLLPLDGVKYKIKARCEQLCAMTEPRGSQAEADAKEKKSPFQRQEAHL